MKILAMQGFDHLMGTVGTGLARSMSALVASGWNIPNLQAPNNLGYIDGYFPRQDLASAQ